MNKKVVTFFAVAGMTVGGAVPMLWGDMNFFDAASLLLSTIGGFLGIWLAVWLSKKFDF